jgi:tetratricopeptide (TPR) repeat protein
MCKWKKNLIKRLAFIVVCVLILTPSPASADIAPPAQPPGSSVVPGNETTQVRMVSEMVVIDVQKTAPTGSLGQARVTASFTMNNLGNDPESMAVRFPLTFLNGSSDGFGNFPEIKEIAVRVNGAPTPTQRIESNWSDLQSSPWAAFDITFPPGEDVQVEVKYLAEAEGEYPYVSYKYILETGADWNGTIGSADLIVRLPYEANSQNVIFDTQIGWSETTPGGVVTGREVRWHYEDFEPDWENNLEVSLVMPTAWEKVLTEQANVAQNPKDGEAWGRLGKAYKEIFFMRRGFREDAGGLETYHLSQEAYEKSLDLLPRDAAWHAGFAELLYIHYYFSEFFRSNPNHAEALRALQELDLSLAINPQEPKALAILDDMRYSLPEAVRFENEHYVFTWLTATPTNKPTQTQELPTATPLPTIAPSFTPKPTLTQPPAVSPTKPSPTVLSATPVIETQTPTSSRPSSPICRAAAIMPLAAAMWILKKRR